MLKTKGSRTFAGWPASITKSRTLAQLLDSAGLSLQSKYGEYSLLDRKRCEAEHLHDHLVPW